jgi:succinate dehydrogenase / fumarate reductase flavoprotein subunit
VDYDLQSTIPGLFVIGEANFSDHGANRLGASALMQGLADGYFILPYTIGDFLARYLGEKRMPSDAPAFRQVEQEAQSRMQRFLSIGGDRSVDSFHRELGHVMWEQCGMSRTAEGLDKAIADIAALEASYWRDLKVVGTGEELNQSLEKAGRVADFFELARLMCIDARHREESAGGHFREEYQTEDGEALRNDEEFSYVAAWEWTGSGAPPALHKEPLEFEHVHPSKRSYK